MKYILTRHGHCTTFLVFQFLLHLLLLAMKITIRKLSGPEVTLEVAEREPVLSVKRMICEKLSVPIDQQHLVFKGKTLTNASFLHDHNIRGGSKVHLFIRKPNELSRGDGFWHQLRIFLAQHFDQSDADLVLSKYRQDFKSWVHGLSLDQLERMAENHKEEVDKR